MAIVEIKNVCVETLIIRDAEGASATIWLDPKALDVVIGDGTPDWVRAVVPKLSSGQFDVVLTIDCFADNTISVFRDSMVISLAMSPFDAHDFIAQLQVGIGVLRLQLSVDSSVAPKYSAVRGFVRSVQGVKEVNSSLQTEFWCVIDTAHMRQREGNRKSAS